ncbi:MAG: hypothetical protein HKL82_01560 [Acidimicrobiaceae bacterium]|nr:hypothetical protein [Acidimicrobiaceae bacterium]
MADTSVRKKREISDDQKEALSVGRDQSRIVRRYLEAISESKPRPGRKRTEESIRSQLASIDARLADANPLNRLHFIQLKMDLELELSQLQTKMDLAPLERAFIEVAAEYSSRKGVSKHAWREVGVPAEVLKRAGISDSSSGYRKAGHSEDID